MTFKLIPTIYLLLIILNKLYYIIEVINIILDIILRYIIFLFKKALDLLITTLLFIIASNL